MDDTACNYNADATIADTDLCDYACWGCMDETACNYDASATYDFGCNMDCWGCMDPGACNFEETAEYPCDDCCDFSECLGCMDDTACDYDEFATIPDDCVDWDSCVGCMEAGMTYPSGLYTPYANYCPDCDFNTYGSGYIQDDESASTSDILAGDVVDCVPLLSECGLCADGTLDCFNEDGCTDWFAVNYNPGASSDDGSCLYYVEGCMDATACNYDVEATQEDGSCIYVDGICETCSGETDGTGTIVDNDADDDTVCNCCDLCPGFDDLEDADGDSTPNACDVCPFDATDDTGYPNGICDNEDVPLGYPVSSVASKGHTSHAFGVLSPSASSRSSNPGHKSQQLQTVSSSASLSTIVPVPSVSPEHVSHIPSTYIQEPSS
jgi:hypothetical protein